MRNYRKPVNEPELTFDLLSIGVVHCTPSMAFEPPTHNTELK